MRQVQMYKCLRSREAGKGRGLGRERVKLRKEYSRLFPPNPKSPAVLWIPLVDIFFLGNYLTNKEMTLAAYLVGTLRSPITGPKRTQIGHIVYSILDATKVGNPGGDECNGVSDSQESVSQVKVTFLHYKLEYLRRPMRIF